MTPASADPGSASAASASVARAESEAAHASSAAGPGAAGAVEPSPTRASGASAPLAAVGAAGANGGGQSFDYFAALYERILGVHDYPRRARREQIEGTVLVSIRIDRRGHIASARVRESSGSALLDRHALRTVERAAPFGAVPAGTDDRELDFDLPLEYRLR